MPFANIPPVVKNLLIINILMLLITYVLQSTYGIDLVSILGLYYFKSPNFEPYQVVTHMFMHGGTMHLFFNMFALWMFGRVLETVWGSKRFFIYYIATGLGAAFFHTLVGWLRYHQLDAAVMAFNNAPSPELFTDFVKSYAPQAYSKLYDVVIAPWEEAPRSQAYIEQAKSYMDQIVAMRMNIPTVGASGAVFGILLAFGMLFPNTRLMLLIPPIPIKAKYFVIGYGLIELYAGVANRAGDNVAHFAHLGGMIFGFLIIKYWFNKQRPV